MKLLTFAFLLGTALVVGADPMLVNPHFSFGSFSARLTNVVAQHTYRIDSRSDNGPWVVAAKNVFASSSTQTLTLPPFFAQPGTRTFIIRAVDVTTP